jgi:hypothetical protein
MANPFKKIAHPAASRQVETLFYPVPGQIVRRQARLDKLTGFYPGKERPQKVNPVVGISSPGIFSVKNNGTNGLFTGNSGSGFQSFQEVRNCQFSWQR